MACNTLICFLLDIWFRKQHDLLFSNSFFGCFGFLVWWWMLWGGQWEIGCQQIRVCRWYWLEVMPIALLNIVVLNINKIVDQTRLGFYRIYVYKFGGFLPCLPVISSYGSCFIILLSNLYLSSSFFVRESFGWFSPFLWGGLKELIWTSIWLLCDEKG